jgi:hypothetical protein
MRMKMKRCDTRRDAYCIHDNITYSSKHRHSLQGLKQVFSANHVSPSRTSFATTVLVIVIGVVDLFTCNTRTTCHAVSTSSFKSRLAHLQRLHRTFGDRS